MTTSFQSNGKHYLAVEVPDKYVGKEMSIRNGTTLAMNNQRFEFLPHGFQYSILGLASEMTEEQWAGVIDVSTEYPDKYSVDGYSFYSAKTASAMLMDSLNLNPETTLIIEKR